MQTGGLWKELQTAHSGVPTTIHTLDTQSLSNRCGPPSPPPCFAAQFLLKSLSSPLLCVASPFSFWLSLRYLYIGCPNFPPCRDRAFNPFLVLGSQQSSRERSRLSQMKSRAKHVIKNAEWYSFLRQALRRQVRHIPRSFVVRKQSA